MSLDYTILSAYNMLTTLINKFILCLIKAKFKRCGFKVENCQIIDKITKKMAGFDSF